MRRISALNAKIIHTKRAFFRECFVAPNAMVGTQRIISIGFEKFCYTVKSNMGRLFQIIYALSDIDIGKTVFVFQNKYVLLINDVLGKPLQQDFRVFKTRHWVVQKIIVYVCNKKNRELEVEIVLLKMSLESKRDFAKVLRPRGQISLLPPMVICTL